MLSFFFLYIIKLEIIVVSLYVMKIIIFVNLESNKLSHLW